MNNNLKSWSLVEFAKEFGKKLKYAANCVNKETGDHFNQLAFCDDFADANKKITFVMFAKKLGNLTAEEVKNRKNELQVIEAVSENGNTGYYLSARGENSWEDIEL